MKIFDVVKAFGKVPTFELETCDLVSVRTFTIAQKGVEIDHETTATLSPLAPDTSFELELWNDLEGTVLELSININIYTIGQTISAVYQMLDAYNALEKAHEHIATLVDDMDAFNSSF